VSNQCFDLAIFLIGWFLGAQYAPVSGLIREINENLNDRPGLLNKSPEEEGMLVNIMLASELNSHAHGVLSGWLCKIEVSDRAEVRVLPRFSLQLFHAPNRYFFLA
jgi:glycine cleavage system H lipoate-binding protein